MNTTSGGADERLWKPEVDKTGNGYAVIRFLPAPQGEDIPWVKMYSHAAVTAPDQFKSYDDLKKRLDYVLGHKQPARRVFDEEVANEDNSRGSYAPDFNSRKAEATVAAAVSSPASEDEDDALKYFQKLAEE